MQDWVEKGKAPDQITYFAREAGTEKSLEPIQYALIPK